MMKSLFMVWYFAGNIALTAGPLPYDIHECETRATEALVEIQALDEKSELEGLEIKCEYHAKRPILTKENNDE